MDWPFNRTAREMVASFVEVAVRDRDLGTAEEQANLAKLHDILEEKLYNNDISEEELQEFVLTFAGVAVKVGKQRGLL